MVVSSNSSDGRKEIRKNLYAVVEEILTIHLSSTSARSRPWDKGIQGPFPGSATGNKRQRYKI